MFGILVGIFMLVALVVVHEYGHFLAARRNGVEVKEFGIGFPPRLLGRKMGKGIFRGYYSINLIPLGGFVRLKGENESARSKGSFGAAPLNVKVKIAIAGVAMNALIGLLFFTYLAGAGMPQFVDNQFRVEGQVTQQSSKVAIAGIEPDSPAETISLKEGDVIKSVGGIEVFTGDEFIEALDGSAGEEVSLEYYRNGNLKQAELTLNSTDSEDGILGVKSSQLDMVKHSWLSAPLVGVGTVVQFSYLTVEGVVSSLIRLVSGNFGAAAENVTGPIGIFGLLDSMSALGANYVIFFAGIISITLAVINILPLPALDGGRLLVSLVVNIYDVKLTQMRENIIHLSGFAIMLILAILITIVDIGRI